MPKPKQLRAGLPGALHQFSRNKGKAPCCALHGGEGHDYFRIPDGVSWGMVAGMPWMPGVPCPVPGVPRRKPRARRAAVPSTGPLSKAGFTSRSKLFWMAGKSELR